MPGKPVHSCRTKHWCLLSSLMREGEIREAESEGENMPYQYPFDVLSSGKANWNKWRLLYADVQGYEPDLHMAQLCTVDLHGADLRRADLTEANLQEADLQEANLHGADLRHADLRNANLRNADLSRANLRGADLRNANLSLANLEGAELDHADFRGADLHDTNLTNALCLQTASFDAMPVISEGISEADCEKHVDDPARRYL